MRRASLLHAIPHLLLTGAFLWMAGLLAVTTASRLGYPFDLEWMEGGMLLHALRVSEGEPLYVSPSARFIPYIYPPLYPWLVALSAQFAGVSYGLGRALSLAGSAAATILLVLAIRREGHPWSLGLGAAAVFLSTYDDCGAFFDLVRTDGLLMGLLAGTLVVGRAASPRAVRAAGLLLALAFATKHNTAIFGIPIALSLWRHHGRRRALTFTLWSAVPALAFVGVMQVASGGLFLTYLLEVPASHPLVANRMWPLAEKELLLTFPVFLGLGLAGAIIRIRHWRFASTWWVSNVVVGFVACIFMRGHHGGFLNVLIPGFWLLSLAGGLGLGAALRRLPRTPVLAVAALGALFEVVRGGWEPARYHPTDQDRQAGENLLEVIASYPGPVLVPHAPYYPVMVGKEPGFHLIALWDVTHDGTPFPEAAADLEAGLAAGRFDAIILARSDLGHGLARHYERTRRISYERGAFRQKTGWRARPRLVFEPKETSADSPGAAEDSPDPH